ncbi:helix-turn-helix domain-containing protein [Bordetella genomosp. 11]|uniref:Transcriptional regulator n=1 Tax=Bordetella genomosp. 11 TaxID=1416808 RepID=A0A261UXX4_9BORD|nr:helix-turn-helix transcriptional regulator [Bordetella genomosp. 11]OZI66729.1 transcriptional regulator [Bordetella genomosp. 11]
MTLQYDEIGRRLKAFRLASGLSADEIAQRIGISRTALYRFEKGELAKIETLEKLSELLQVSMPTLLGVGMEYLASAVSYFERTRQLEETADQIIVLAGPISFLLASDQFEVVLEQVLRESIPDDVPHRDKTLADVDKIMEILHTRKQTYRRRRPSIVNLISTVQIERFLVNGMVGRADLSEAKRAKRLEMARQEIEHLADMIEEDSMGVQIGLVTDNLPHNGFQIFRQAERSTITISPFRLGEQPNIRVGVAMATSAPEALKLHENIVQEAWRTALKGNTAAEFLRGMLANRQKSLPPAARRRGPAK